MLNTFRAMCRSELLPFVSPVRRKETMKYLLLIYDEETIWANMGEAERNQIFGEYMRFSSDIKTSGHWLGGAPLQPTSTATSVRIRNQKRMVTDGPFAETREQLGGYYLIEAKDLDEAIGIAARIPSARLGTIEVRPIMEIPAQA
jgi:hypothetical protein